uniref:PPM-type phosphatase domain-containing protein n=1 Tax=Desulfatirhabdium butyrativorans TaxID=340467 RepID=A0A7C4MLY5_9BACT
MACCDTMNPTIQVNPALRAVRFGNAVTAALIGSWDKNNGMFGNGDCLLVDVRHRVFALSDASERSPQASRRLLQAIAAGMCTAPWPECLHSAWCSQPYVQKATFVGIQLQMNPRPEAVVFSGGDSTLLIFDGRTGKILYRNPVNMHFVGRMSAAPSPVRVPLTPESRILLASDGLTDVLDRNDDGHPPQFLRSMNHPQSWLAWLLDEVRRLRHEAFLHDDIAVINIDPFALKDINPCDGILLGGTTASEEKTFVHTALPNQWFSIDRAACTGYLKTMGLITIPLPE